MTASVSNAAYSADGYTVLRAALDASRLRAEIESSLNDAFRSSIRTAVGGSAVEFRYVPMMCDLTPTSVGLVDQLAGVAEGLLGRHVLPVRAKGVQYAAETAWHRDSESIVLSVGFLAYLDDLRAETGALRVRPASHVATGTRREPVPVETHAGDIIVMDEHLEHASFGGSERIQWRVDYVADPASEAELAATVSYFSGIYSPDWDGGYDAVKYPSYGATWLTEHPRWAARLAELGVLPLAARHEAAFAVD